MKRLVLDQRNEIGYGLGSIEGIKVKVKMKTDLFDEKLSLDGEPINENNIDGYDWEEYFSNIYYFGDQDFLYGEMSRIVDKAVDKVAPDEYFISLEEDDEAGVDFAAIWLEDVEVRGDEVILTMIVDVVYYDEENYPW